MVGPKYGMWGLRKYGTTLKNIDCLEFWPDRLRCLSDLIQQQQEAAKKLAVPAAFVTFKWVALLPTDPDICSQCPGHDSFAKAMLLFNS